MGIEKVILHYEGRTIEILRPTMQVIKDINGKERSYFGWWATIAKPTNLSGHAHVYWEAIPEDSTMQKRVIGPIQFSPQTNQYDANITISPSNSVQTGMRYQSIEDALDWCAANKRQNPMITLIEPGVYDLGKINAVYQGEGYAHISASAPVRISAAAGAL